MRTYFLIKSLVFAIIVLFFTFSILPKIETNLADLFPPQELQKIKREFIQLSIILCVFLFGVNLFLFRFDQSFEEEKEKIEKLLEITPSDENLHKKLKEIEKKKSFYYSLFESIFGVVGGLAIGFFASKFISPFIIYLALLNNFYSFFFLSNIRAFIHSKISTGKAKITIFEGSG